ncbi:MAG: molybdopterin dinucleotide binding domain-containing protein, partial [Candidatus Altarchaeaceae archaeon]
WGISYEQLPKGAGYSTQVMIRKAREGKIKALIVWGENPMVSSPNLNIVKEAFKNLELLIVVDIFESETASAERNENSLTYLLPACTFAEKAGSVTNSGRCVQWRYKAINPLYESKSDLEILINLAKKLYEKGVLNFDKNRFKDWKEAFNYVFNYGYDPDEGNFDNEKVAENVLKEVMNCCWIYNSIGKYSGVIETRDKDEFGDDVINKGTNYAKRRDNMSDNGEGIYPGWGWTWPINRHVLYYVYPEKGKNLEIEYKFKDDRYRPNKRGVYVIPNDGFLTKEGVAALGALTSPLKDGFLPKHMEPIESPYPELVEKYPPYVKFDPDPAKNTSNVGELEIGNVNEFPYVLTTFRLLEHMLAGQLTRNIPYLVELEPEPFCEINEKLAKEKGIKDGDYVKISTKRGSIIVRARVNGRVNEKTVAVTWHWGFKGLSTGDSANYLTIDAVDPNANIPEYKVGLCNIEKV